MLNRYTPARRVPPLTCVCAHSAHQLRPPVSVWTLLQITLASLSNRRDRLFPYVHGICEWAAQLHWQMGHFELIPDPPLILRLILRHANRRVLCTFGVSTNRSCIVGNHSDQIDIKCLTPTPKQRFCIFLRLRKVWYANFI